MRKLHRCPAQSRGVSVQNHAGSLVIAYVTQLVRVHVPPFIIVFDPSTVLDVNSTILQFYEITCPRDV